MGSFFLLGVMPTEKKGHAYVHLHWNDQLTMVVNSTTIANS